MNGDKYFWMVYLNDSKDTLVCCGDMFDVCDFLKIKPNSLWRYMNRKQRIYHPKYLIFKYLASDLDKEDDYEG